MKNDSVTTLADLAVGQSGTIQTLLAQGQTRRRLLDLGFVPGTCVTNLRRSFAGDPIAFAVRGTTIALRTEEGQQVLISPAPYRASLS